MALKDIEYHLFAIIVQKGNTNKSYSTYVNRSFGNDTKWYHFPEFGAQKEVTWMYMLSIHNPKIMFYRKKSKQYVLRELKKKSKLP